MDVSLTTQEVKLLELTIVDPQAWLTQLAKQTARRNKQKLLDEKNIVGSYTSTALDALLASVPNALEQQQLLDASRLAPVEG